MEFNCGLHLKGISNHLNNSFYETVHANNLLPIMLGMLR